MKKYALATLTALMIALTAPVHAQKTAGQVVDDNTVNASVKAALLDADKVPSSGIVVETYKGVVLLSGFVETKEQKEKAGKVAAGVTGARKVHNALAVQPGTSMGAKLDDSVITGKVKAALMDDKDVKSGQINVETRNGVVSLGGFVTGKQLQKRAVEVAKGVSGVKSVVDAMYVKPD